MNELGITVTDQDIVDADISGNGKIEFSEFLLLCAFKWADKDIDAKNQNNELDDKETAMALRLLGMELKREEFDQALEPGKTGLDFATFTSLAAFKKVTKDNKPLDRQKLENAIDYLGFAELANTKRALNTELRAEQAKLKQKSSEEEEKAKLEAEKDKAALEAHKLKASSDLEEAAKKAVADKQKDAFEQHLKGLKLCASGQVNDANTLNTDKQKCLELDQVNERLGKITKKCDATLTNPPDMNDFPLKQVCQQGGRSIMSLRQFVKFIQSLRNKQRKMYY
jgi:hypothetical protein